MSVPADCHQIGACETCRLPVYEGSPCHMTADGCVLCEEHAPMLSDVLRQYREIVAEDPFHPGDLPFDTPEEMRETIASLEAEIAATGDRKVLHP